MSIERQVAARIVEQYERKLEEQVLTASTSHNNMSDTQSNTNIYGSQNGSSFDAKSLLLASTGTSKDNRKIQILRTGFICVTQRKVKKDRVGILIFNLMIRMVLISLNHLPSLEVLNLGSYHADNWEIAHQSDGDVPNLTVLGPYLAHFKVYKDDLFITLLL